MQIIMGLWRRLIICLHAALHVTDLTRLVSYAVKVVWQSLNLLYVLFFKCNSSFLLIQNPPAIPAIPVSWFYCYASRVELAIDWHNYAHTIMALSLGQNHFLVRLATSIESYFGAKARHNFCVTKAMQEDLDKKWRIQYDYILSHMQLNGFVFNII